MVPRYDAREFAARSLPPPLTSKTLGPIERSRSTDRRTIHAYFGSGIDQVTRTHGRGGIDRTYFPSNNRGNRRFIRGNFESSSFR